MVADDPKTIESMGEGVKHEVIHNTLEEYQINTSHWFSQWEDGHCTLATAYPLSMAQYIPDAHKHDLSILGATAAICLICGMPAAPLDPMLLHFFIHKCDLHSIHPVILGEWHLSLKQIVSDWITLGPNSNANTDTFWTHFLMYQDLQVSYIVTIFSFTTFLYNHRWPTCPAGIK